MDNDQIKLFPPSTESWAAQSGARQIAVLMSGGVDSSVTAVLLKKAGWQVLGITMKISVPQGYDHPRPCCGIKAALVCRELGICHYFLSVEQAFYKLVIDPFRRAYMQGFTPSPCVDCNTFLKFSLVWDFLEKTFGIRYLATGHYARLVHQQDHVCLARAKHRPRDQSYFLYGIPRGRLDRFVLPLGEMTKEQVRQLAGQQGLPVAHSQDSMELCFAGQGDYRQALGQDAAPRLGPILDSAGKVLGQHQGVFNYTLGQRRGLGIAHTEPLYVTRICPADNSVTLGTRQEVLHRCVSMTDVNVFLPDKLRIGQELLGQIRSPSQASTCTLVQLEPQITVEFAHPQFAPCPGQRLVLYDHDQTVVAGGTIIKLNNSPTVSQTDSMGAT